MKVLIADDSPLISKRLAQMLGELDQVQIVGPAPDGEIALRLFEDHRPDVVLLDLEMPVRNGVETLIEIRKRDKTSTVIVLTNYDLPEFRTACIRAGADFFLKKFTEFERVLGILNDLLQHRNHKTLTPES
jgi:DNA-binding NarL/FixJ family response regulator